MFFKWLAYIYDVVKGIRAVHDEDFWGNDYPFINIVAIAVVELMLVPGVNDSVPYLYQIIDKAFVLYMLFQFKTWFQAGNMWFTTVHGHLWISIGRKVYYSLWRKRKMAKTSNRNDRSTFNANIVGRWGTKSSIFSIWAELTLWK